MKSNEENIIREKSYAFAVRIVRLCRYVSKDKKDAVIVRQLLRAGTSIGANVEESIGAQSRADFVSKLSIAYKEARESEYWIRLMADTDILTQPEFQSIHADVVELLKILTAIKKTTRESLKK